MKAAIAVALLVIAAAPGAPDSQINQSLYPKAPNLAAAAKDWTPAELYVVTKNGIKMSGMPAWGPTHSEEELWSLVKSGQPSGHGH